MRSCIEWSWDIHGATGACMVLGSMCGARGCAWYGGGIRGARDMHSAEGACMVLEWFAYRRETGGTHPTGMHSSLNCKKYTPNNLFLCNIMWQLL